MDRALDGCPEDHKEDIGVWRSIFDPQNGFFQTIDLIFNLAALSLLWVALCIPVVTAGPATTALYYTLVKCIRKGEPHPFRNFLECLKSNFKVSFLSGLVCLVLGQFVLGGLYVVYQMALAGSRPAMSLLLERIFRPYTIPEEGLPDDPEERPWYLR